MGRPTGILLATVALSLALAGSAAAQNSSDHPSSGGVAQQFQSGANTVGHGAVQIGEGIKQGAILTWHALKAGATSFAAQFNGNRGSSGQDHANSATKSP